MAKPMRLMQFLRIKQEYINYKAVILTLLTLTNFQFKSSTIAFSPVIFEKWSSVHAFYQMLLPSGNNFPFIFSQVS